MSEKKNKKPNSQTEGLTNKKMYLDKYDIMKMFDCCETKALSIMRGIKSVSDTLHLKGKITHKDLDTWIEQCGNPVTDRSVANA